MKILAITPDRKRDYTTEQVIEGLRSLDVSFDATGLGNGINQTIEEEEILSRFDYDAVISFFGKVRDNNPPKHHILDKIKIDKKKTCYIDGSEWTYTGHRNKDQIIISSLHIADRRGEPWLNEKMKESCGTYFKRECYPQDSQIGVVPFPFSLSNRHILDKTNEKDIDAMCVFGQNQTGLRKQVEDSCLKLQKKYPEKKFIICSNLSKEEYVDVLKRSRIVIDAWGGGDNCDRFFEAIGSKSVCFHQKYNVVFPNAFIDMESAVTFENILEFEEKLKILINNKKMTQEIGIAGFDHAKKFHTVQDRARLVLESVGIK